MATRNSAVGWLPGGFSWNLTGLRPTLCHHVCVLVYRRGPSDCRGLHGDASP
jgi:hypothetical protein